MAALRRHMGRARCAIAAGAFAAAVLFAAAPPSIAQSGRSGGAHATVTGSTVYDTGHLLAFAYHHIRESEGTVTAPRLAAAIELVYREDGFLLAEVEVVPTGSGGHVGLRVREGYIEELSIEGVDKRLHQAIHDIVRPLIGVRPLRRAEFERAIMLVDDLAGLHVTTEIDYPRAGGGARLRILASSARASGSVTIDNPPRQLGQALSAHGEQSFYSLLAAGDVLRLYAGATLHFADGDDGREIYGLGTYRKPVGPNGTFIEGIAGNVQAKRDASGKFVSTDLAGRMLGAAIGHPFLRDFHRYGYGLIEFRHAAAESRGGGFRFESTANVGAAALLYGHVFDGGGSFEIVSTLSSGRRAESAPAGTDDGDDSFWHLRTGAGIVAPLVVVGPHVTLRGEVVAQLSRSRLPGVEEFHLGDRYLMRGYALAEVSGDSGVAGKLELSRQIDVHDRIVHSLRPFAFVDLGYVRNNDAGRFEVDSKSLASVGAGLDASLADNFSLRSWIGVPLEDGPHTKRHAPAGYVGVTKAW